MTVRVWQFAVLTGFDLFRRSCWSGHHALHRDFEAHFFDRVRPGLADRDRLSPYHLVLPYDRDRENYPHFKDLQDYASVLAIGVNTCPVPEDGILSSSSLGTLLGMLPTSMTFRPLLVTVVISPSPSSSSARYPVRASYSQCSVVLTAYSLSELQIGRAHV